MGKIKEKIGINEKIEEELKAIFSGDIPWVTIVWDDPVNLMTYVTYVLMELFGYSKVFYCRGICDINPAVSILDAL